MKILHLGKYYPPFHGGMEIYLRDLSEQQAHNHLVTAIVHNHEYGRLLSKTVKESVNHVNIIRQNSIKPILFTPIMLGLNKCINQLCAEKKVDVIHIAWPNPSALFLLLNKNAKSKPWIIQWQSDMVTKRSSWLLKLAYQFFKPLEKILLKKAQHIICSSEQYCQHSNILPQFKHKCSIIPLGMTQKNIDINEQDRNWALKQWGSAKYRIYNIGRLTFYKNHQLLIKAAQSLPEAQFIITGTGELRESLLSLIDQLQLKNIQLTGALDSPRLNALLSTCDAFCLPSNDRAESYGMVLLEALSHGKKILVSNLAGSGMQWIAQQTDLGHTFNCDDHMDLVSLIKKTTLSNRDNKIKQQNLPNQLTIKGCAQSIDQLYASL